MDEDFGPIFDEEDEHLDTDLGPILDETLYPIFDEEDDTSNTQIMVHFLSLGEHWVSNPKPTNETVGESFSL